MGGHDGTTLRPRCRRRYPRFEQMLLGFLVAKRNAVDAVHQLQSADTLTARFVLLHRSVNARRSLTAREPALMIAPGRRRPHHTRLMAQDLLAAVGARIEALLNVKDARSRTLEETLRASVSKNPPAPFTLLSDGGRQFGYAPGSDEISSRISDATLDAQNEFGSGFRSLATAPSAEDISAAIAPFAALLSGTAQVLTQNAAPSNSVTGLSAPVTVPVSVLVADSAPVNVPVSVQTSAPTSAPVNVPVAVQFSAPVNTAGSPAAFPTASSSASTVTSNANRTNSNTASRTPVAAAPGTAANVASPTSVVDNAVPAPFVMLADGTKQFGYAPTGGLINRVPNVTPNAPAEFGIGATVRRLGVLSDAPMTVTQISGGFVRATVTNSTGTHIFEFPFNQFELITRAPGT